MKFYHTADNHLGASLKSASFQAVKGLPSRTHEHFETFYRLLDTIDENQVDLFFITGDLFDSHHLTYRNVEQVLKRLQALNAQVFLIIGNHDTFLHKHVFQTLLKDSNIHIFDHSTQKVSLEDVDIYGFNTSDFSEALLNEVNQSLNKDKHNVLLLHGDILNKKDPHYLTDLSQLKATQFDYIGLGHIHKQAFLTPHIAYSGNLEPLDFSEVDSKGYIEGDLKTKTYHFVPFQKRMFHVLNVLVSETDDLYAIKDKIIHAARDMRHSKDFFRIILEGVHAPSEIIDTEALSALLMDTFYYVELLDQTTPAIDLKTMKKTYKDTIIETLINQYEASDNATLESLHLALYALLKTEEV